MANINEMPKYTELMNPQLAALQMLGGGAHLDDIDQLVAECLGLADDVWAEGMVSKPRVSLYTNKCAWARVYLKAAGYMKCSGRGIWWLTEMGETAIIVDPMNVVKYVNGQLKMTGTMQYKSEPISTD